MATELSYTRESSRHSKNVKDKFLFTKKHFEKLESTSRPVQTTNSKLNTSNLLKTSTKDFSSNEKKCGVSAIINLFEARSNPALQPATNRISLRRQRINSDRPKSMPASKQIKHSSSLDKVSSSESTSSLPNKVQELTADLQQSANKSESCRINVTREQASHDSDEYYEQKEASETGEGELTFSSLKSIVESWGNKSESSSLSISNQLNYKDKLQNFKESRKKNKVQQISQSFEQLSTSQSFEKTLTEDEKENFHKMSASVPSNLDDNQLRIGKLNEAKIYQPMTSSECFPDSTDYGDYEGNFDANTDAFSAMNDTYNADQQQDEVENHTFEATNETYEANNATFDGNNATFDANNATFDGNNATFEAKNETFEAQNGTFEAREATKDKYQLPVIEDEDFSELFWYDMPGIQEQCEDEDYIDDTEVKKNRIVSFSTQPIHVCLTYTHDEYDRVNDDTDPIAASAEYELEKRLDKMNIFDVDITKGTMPLGLSLVGIGVGADSGVEKLGMFVKNVVPGGSVDIDGRIKVYDQIIAVDGVSLVGITQKFAAKVLSNSSDVIRFSVGREIDQENSEIKRLMCPQPPQEEESQEEEGDEYEDEDIDDESVASQTQYDFLNQAVIEDESDDRGLSDPETSEQRTSETPEDSEGAKYATYEDTIASDEGSSSSTESTTSIDSEENVIRQLTNKIERTQNKLDESFNQVTNLERKYNKAKILIKQFQSREDEFLRREEKFKTHINKLEKDLNMIKLKKSQENPAVEKIMTFINESKNLPDPADMKMQNENLTSSILHELDDVLAVNNEVVRENQDNGETSITKEKASLKSVSNVNKNEASKISDMTASMDETYTESLKLDSFKFRPNSMTSTTNSTLSSELPANDSEDPNEILKLADWSTMQLCDWLRSCKLGVHTDAFKQHNIKGENVISMNINFKVMGITNKQAKSQLKKKLKELRSTHEKRIKQIGKKNKKIRRLKLGRKSA